MLQRQGSIRDVHAPIAVTHGVHDTSGLPPEIAADLGSLITVRKHPPSDRLAWSIFVLLPLLGLGLAGLAWSVHVAFNTHWFAGVMFASLAMLAFLGFSLLARHVFQELRFHELGLIESRWGRHEVLRYDDIRSMQYSVERMFSRGIYGGTRVGFTLWAADGRTVRFTGRHKERAKGLRIFGRGARIEGEDELDSLQFVFARSIADRLEAELAAGHAVPWTPALVMTAEGVRARRGRYRDEVLRWDELEGASVEGGRCRVFARSDPRPMALIPCNARDFWPGLMVCLSRLPPTEP